MLSALEPSGGTCATTCPSFMDVAWEALVKRMEDSEDEG